MDKVINILEKYSNTLKMDVNSFYPMLVSIFTVMISLFLFLRDCFLKNKERKEKKMFELYSKRESDNFYVYIMLIEIVIMSLSVIGVCFICTLIEIYVSGNTLTFGTKLELTLSIVVSIALSLKMIKMNWVRKRILGDKKGKKIILCSIFFLSIAVLCKIWGSKVFCFGDIFMGLYFINEIIGLFHFQGRYTRYDFSSIRLYLNSGESIVCEEIEKIRRQKEYIFIDFEDKRTVLQYHEIRKVEYYGPPKIILNEGIKNHLSKLSILKKYIWKEKNMNNKLIKEISFIAGNIADKEDLDKKNIDTIVNAANPTLMGSNQGVDGAIHKAIDEIQGESGYFKNKICEELKTENEENRIRCQRGEAVVTFGGGLCKKVIHVVGAKYDGEQGRFHDCSSSAVQILESCYNNIVKAIKEHPDIQNVAIPIISSGEYGFPFQTAAKIAVASIYNAILEWKQQDPEIFEMSRLEKIYFYVYDGEQDVLEKKLQEGNEILKKYEPIMMKEKRVVFQSSFEAHFRYWKEIADYDETRGYFSVAKFVRELLMFIRLPFLLTMALKDWIGKENWVNRRRFVEWFAIVKMFIPVLFYLIGQIQITAGCLLIDNLFFSIIIIYSMLDTITYLLTLIIMADIQSPSANIIRSMIMLFVNYIEVSLGMSYLYFVYYKQAISLGEALAFGVLNLRAGNQWTSWLDYLFVYVNTGIKFFFITLVFGYFANHMHQRKFRS